MRAANDIIITQMDLEKLLRRILGCKNVPRDLKSFAEATIYHAQELIDHEECMVYAGGRA